MVFLRCDIENPAFDSQTKDFMNTPIGKFGSSCTVSDKFIEKLAKMGKCVFKNSQICLKKWLKNGYLG